MLKYGIFGKPLLLYINKIYRCSSIPNILLLKLRLSSLLNLVNSFFKLYTKFDDLSIFVYFTTCFIIVEDLLKCVNIVLKAGKRCFWEKS